MRIAKLHLGLVPVLAVLLWTTSAAHAALISNFTDLRTELSDRLGVLSNSVIKAELKQAKACTKGIAIIDKSLTLASDIKASAKLAKLMEKTFPDEFAPLLVGGITFSNNVRSLVFDGYNAIGEQLSSIISSLQLNISELPEGKDRDKAQAALDKAQAALDDAANAFFEEENLKATTKFFGSCLKSAAKAQKIINKVQPK